MKIKRNKKKYKSVITERIINSTKKIGLVFGCLILILSFGKISGTNSYFSDTSSTSSNSFSAGYWVPPQVEVTSPSSGDEWQVGSTHNINWTIGASDPNATIDSVVLDYTCDDGATYASIDSFSSDPGTYSWTVPENISDKCRIRIAATDSNALTNSEESDEFEISWMVVLNEFVPNPASEDLEFVEIYNYGNEPIDVDDWFITDNQGPASHQRIIDATHTNTGSTIINPSSNRFLVIENYSSFYLNNDGDEVRLYDNASNLVDSHNFSNATQGKSYARIPDGVGNWVDPVPTPGEKNNSSSGRDDMKKYYKKACFDNDKPICKKSFLKSMGLWEEEKKENSKEKKEKPKEKNSAEVSAEASSLPAETKSDDSSENDSKGDAIETENNSQDSKVEPQDNSDAGAEEENSADSNKENQDDNKGKEKNEARDEIDSGKGAVLKKENQDDKKGKEENGDEKKETKKEDVKDESVDKKEEVKKEEVKKDDKKNDDPDSQPKKEQCD